MTSLLHGIMSGVNSLVDQIKNPPEREVIIENMTAVELSFPVGRDYKAVKHGEITIHPDFFLLSKTIKAGERGIVRFQPSKNYISLLHAALEMEIPNEGYPPDKLYIGASSQIPQVISQWNVNGGLQKFLQSMLPKEEPEKIGVAEGYFSELFYEESLACWKLIVHSRDPGTFGHNSRLQNQAILGSIPTMVNGDFKLILEFHNYTENGISLPPNFALMNIGFIEKDVPYIQKESKSRVEFGGSPEFAGQMFLQVAPSEILVVTVHGIQGDVKFEIHFYDVNPEYESLQLPNNVPSPEYCCGQDGDEIIYGRYCEALITNVSHGQEAHASIGIYPRTDDDL